MAWLGAGKSLMYQSWHLLNMGFCPCRKRTWCSQGSKARVWERFLGVFISSRPHQSSTAPWLDSASTGKAWCPIKSIYVRHQTCLNPHPSGTMHRRPIKEMMTPGPSQHSAVFAKHAQTGATKLERSTPQGLAPLYMTRYISLTHTFLFKPLAPKTALAVRCTGCSEAQGSRCPGTCAQTWRHASTAAVKDSIRSLPFLSPSVEAFDFSLV